MKLCWLAVLLSLAATLSAIAQEAGPNRSTPAPFEAGKEASKARQPDPEMQKLFDAFLGTWTVTGQIEPSEMMPNGGRGRGKRFIESVPAESQ